MQWYLIPEALLYTIGWIGLTSPKLHISILRVYLYCIFIPIWSLRTYYVGSSKNFLSTE